MSGAVTITRHDLSATALGGRRVDLRTEIKTQFGVHVHERTVGKYLAGLG